MSTQDVAYLIALIAAVFIGLANYRNSVRKGDYDRLMSRMVDAEARLAQTEHRATTAEIQAATFRDDVIRIGTQLEIERKLSDRNLGIVAQDAEKKIEKLLIVIEDLYTKIESATGIPPDVDMGALRKMIIWDKEAHVTGPLGPISIIDLVRGNR